MPLVKKKPEKAKIPSTYILLIFTFISLIVMGLSFSGFIPDSFIRNTFGGIILPFQKGVVAVTDTLNKATEKKQTIEELRAENELLKQQISELEEENTLLYQDEYELLELRKLYELDASYSEYPKVGARVVSWDTSNWFSTFIIDKGSDDGIMVDMNVIAGNGLVGRISQVGTNWSRVTSIIEDDAHVSGMILHNQCNLIVSGDLRLYDQGYIGFSQLVDTAGDATMGDKVVTSYISDKYLPGILIGYIATITPDTNHITKSGTISPVVDFSNLSEVLVITTLKEQLDY